MSLITTADERSGALSAGGTVAALRTGVRGQVIVGADDSYEEARRVWNGVIDRRPSVIVRAAGVEDVIAALHFAQEHDLRIAIRGGGHGVAGNGTIDDGLLIDLSAMKSIRIDPVSRRVQVGGGVTLAEIDREAQAFGLAVPLGVVSGTGVAGLTLGGGFGWLTRRYGLSIDQLLSADLVTADGRLVHASKDQEPELFWGIRGGGGNFGIVTAFEFQAHPLGPMVLAGAVFYRYPHWAEALDFYDDWASTLPDELTTIASFATPPPTWLPEGLRGETLMLIGFAWAGSDPSTPNSLLDTLRGFGPPDFESIGPTRWVDWQSSQDELFPKGVRAFWKNASFDRLDRETIDAIIDGARVLPSTRTSVDIHHLDGAFARVDESATAFPNRSARYWLNIVGTWDHPADDDRAKTWVRQFHASMRPHQAAGEYVNFLGLEDRGTDPRESARAAYGPEKFSRLVALKDRFDPDNIFRLNHNIPPRNNRSPGGDERG